MSTGISEGMREVVWMDLQWLAISLKSNFFSFYLNTEGLRKLFQIPLNMFIALWAPHRLQIIVLLW